MSVLSTNAEIIGAGAMWRGVVDPDARLEVPRPLAAGTPLGQHLRVRRLARVMPGRQLYVVDNVGPKWSRRKCWSCGNKYSPGHARICSFCGTPLRDLRFLMTARWDEPLFQPIEDWTRSRKWRLGIISPVALLYRQGLMHSVYHYNSESLLVDEPSPLPGEVVLSMAVKLAEGLIFLHDNGVLLHDVGPYNVMVMPDGSVRWFDLDIIGKVVGGVRGMYRHDSKPIARDTSRLATLLRPYVDPADAVVAGFLQAVAGGDLPTPLELLNGAEKILRSGREWGFSPAAHALTDLGTVREQNEDGWSWQKVSDKLAIYAVADGMGGHAAGEVASELALETVTARLIAGLAGGKVDAEKIVGTVTNAMLEANDAVHKEGRDSRRRMGTTLLAAVLIDNKTLVIGHAGDCRAYLHRKGVLKQLTKDHTLVAELLEDGQITEAEAKDHPRKNVVTVTVGAEKGDLESEVSTLPVQRGDRILLCSDGLWGAVSDPDIEDALTEFDDRRVAVQALFRLAFKGGSKDNVTALIIDI